MMMMVKFLFMVNFCSFNVKVKEGNANCCMASGGVNAFFNRLCLFDLWKVIFSQDDASGARKEKRLLSVLPLSSNRSKYATMMAKRWALPDDYHLIE